MVKRRRRGKGIKLLIALVGIVLVLILGLSLFLRLYLTEERIKALVIPPAKEALGREVAVQRVKVGLFSGVTLGDLVVKERDGKADFLRIPGFVLRFQWLPLFQGKLVISKVEFLRPSVRILRDASGRFNFETLRFIEGAERRGPQATAEKKVPALPLALTVKEVRVKGGELTFRDASGELPKVDLNLDMRVSLALGKGGTSFSFNGDTAFKARLQHEETVVLTDGKARFDQREATWDLKVRAKGEEARLTGGATNYLKRPRIVLNILADTLRLDRVLALKKKAPPRKDKGVRGQGAGGRTRGAKVPLPDLKLSGEMRIGEVIYKGFRVKALKALYEYDKGVVELKSLLAKVAEGKIRGSGVLDLNPSLPRHKARVELEAVRVGPLAAALLSKGEGVLAGTLQATLVSSGRGLRWDLLRRTLDARGAYSLTEGRLLDFKLLRAIATLLKLEEIRTLSFRELKGTFEVKGGKVLLKSDLDGPHVRAKADGEVGLDGSLNLPVLLELSPQLGEKLRRRVGFARYLVAKEGWTTVPLVLKGTVDRPRPALDRRLLEIGVKRTMEEFIKKEDLRKGLPEEFLKGFFGR